MPDPLTDDERQDRLVERVHELVDENKRLVQEAGETAAERDYWRERAIAAPREHRRKLVSAGFYALCFVAFMSGLTFLAAASGLTRSVGASALAFLLFLFLSDEAQYR